MITSTSNPQVKELSRLMKKRRARDEAGVFLVEGPRMIGELIADDHWQSQILKICMSESFASGHEEKATALVQRGNRYQSEIFSDAAFVRISDTRTPQGILAVVKRRSYDIETVINGMYGEKPQAERQPHILVLDNLQDPGNLGTVFRTAEAAGATGIILSSDCVDIYNPKVVRSTMGAVFRMPFLYVDDLPGTIGGLKKAGIRIYAAHLEGKNAYDREDYWEGCAFLIGNEGNGLRNEVAECADCRIRIPMQGKAESLNAAVAASVLMFEVSRQRREHTG